MKTNIKLILFAIFSLILAVPSYVMAEVAPRDGGSSSGGQSALMIQQLSAEKSQLQNENVKLKNDNKKLNDELKKLKKQYESKSKSAGRSEAALSQSQAINNQLTERMTQFRGRMDELVSKFRETATTLKKSEQDNRKLSQEVTRYESELNLCAKNNIELSNIGYEVLDKYENKGMFSSLAQAEKFTGLKRVQIENLVEDYRYMIEDLEYQAKVEKK